MASSNGLQIHRFTKAYANRVRARRKVTLDDRSAVYGQRWTYSGVTGHSLLEPFAWLKGRTDRKERKRDVGVLSEQVSLEDVAQRQVSAHSGACCVDSGSRWSPVAALRVPTATTLMVWPSFGCLIADNVLLPSGRDSARLTGEM